LAEIADRNDAQEVSSKRILEVEPEAGVGKVGAGDRFGNSGSGDGSVLRGIARQSKKLGQAGGSGDRPARSLGLRTLETLLHLRSRERRRVLEDVRSGRI
jgi:hypothetical protein